MSADESYWGNDNREGQPAQEGSQAPQAAASQPMAQTGGQQPPQQGRASTGQAGFAQGHQSASAQEGTRQQAWIPAAQTGWRTSQQAGQSAQASQSTQAPQAQAPKAQAGWQVPQQPAQGFQAQSQQYYQQPWAPPTQGAYASAVPTAPAEQKKGHGWIIAIVIVVCLFAFMAFAVKSCTDAMSTLPTATANSGFEGLSGDTIGIIDMDGTIQYDGSLCSPEGFKEILDRAQDNANIKAIVLRVNSGGGVATAGEEMAEYLRQFEKPVVISSASINASAAYEISAQADYIYVAKSTEIGAIGTVMEMTDLSGLFEKLGISMETITSADSKDSSYGYRPLTDEEREYYQKMVDQINDMFVENVATGRKMAEADVRKLATGLVFTGVDAVGNGLADAIGTREDAVKKAAELAGVSDYNTTKLSLTNYDISSLAYLLGDSSSSTDELISALRALEGRQTK